MNLFKLIALAALLAVAVALSGCASFVTTQTDVSYDEQGNPQRTITTTAKASTVFEARSALSNFKASQTDKTQSATVGSLNQEATATNAVNIVSEVVGAAVRAAVHK